MLPYSVVYLLNLWNITHYQFFPLLIGAVIYLAVQRWSGKSLNGRLSRFVSAGAFLCGAGVAILSALFASPWMAYLAFVLLIAAFLSRFQDKESYGSLGYLALPLLLIWQPPYSPNATGDGILIARLQQVSARFASHSLDLLGVLHESPGTVIHCVGQSFGVEEACSGVQSFFSLICFAALIAVYFRRSLLHAGALLCSSAFWAVVMNTFRITVIPLAYVVSGIDLSHGVVHTLLGLSTMGAGLLLLMSTDQLLLTVASALGMQEGQDSLQNASLSRMSEDARSPRWQFVVMPVLLLILALQGYDIGASWGRQKKTINFFSSDVLVDLFEGDGPSQLGNASIVRYEHEDRIRGADFGERSDIWHYSSSLGDVQLSLDQAFPGWHELTVCYTNMGWKLESRALQRVDGWDIVTANFRNRDGQTGFLVFSMFDESGNPVQAPSDWSSLNALRERIKGRLSPSVRGTLFSLAAYQVQLFAPSVSPQDDVAQSVLVQQFVDARHALRAATLERMQDGFTN
ncbi:MAG: exosortase U [Planctomycetales bacterium]|nr:exosortase U [Planctomycetales bacterium]